MQSLAELIAQAGSSAPAAFPPDTPVGTIVQGTVVSTLTRQRRDIDGKSLFWDADEPGGEKRPQVQAVITIDTGEDLAVEATGEVTTERALFIKTWGPNWKAFVNALKAQGMEDLPEGATLAVTYTGDEPATRKGMNPTKLYSFEVRTNAAAAPVK